MMLFDEHSSVSFASISSLWNINTDHLDSPTIMFDSSNPSKQKDFSSTVGSVKVSIIGTKSMSILLPQLLRVKFQIIVTLILLLFNSCADQPEIHHYIDLVNNTNNSYYAFPSYNSPDTLFYSFESATEILPNEIKGIGSIIGWENLIETIEDKTLIIFLVDKDTLTKYSNNDIVNNYRISRRYDLTVTELDSLDWTITYP
jgi:hypothetical protein